MKSTVVYIPGVAIFAALAGLVVTASCVTVAAELEPEVECMVECVRVTRVCETGCLQGAETRCEADCPAIGETCDARCLDAPEGDARQECSTACDDLEAACFASCPQVDGCAFGCDLAIDACIEESCAGWAIGSPEEARCRTTCIGAGADCTASCAVEEASCDPGCVMEEETCSMACG